MAAALLVSCGRPGGYVSEVWSPDLGDGNYKNPVIYADYSDPDAIRVGEDYYMTASSFGCLPGLPILHSKDLVNWSILSYAIPEALEPITQPERPDHGNHVWAPAIRFHDGLFYIYWGDPDRGVFMVNARDPLGSWSEPVLVLPGYGVIDPCPFWDEDGKAYLVHAYAKSRAGFNSILSICELSEDGSKAVTESVPVFDGTLTQPTCEGPKLYKRGGYYYIFTPAGGFQTGWQAALRSKDIYGPYEEHIAIRQGGSTVTSPRQGAWVDTVTGEDWFLLFQDIGAYGRVVHLEPMKWVDDWPVIGVDEDGDGTGEPVLTYKKPDVGRKWPVVNPQENDEFDGTKIGLQWQWQANINKGWWECDPASGMLRLPAWPMNEDHVNLFDVANMLLQKTPADKFAVTLKLGFHPKGVGERTGLVVMGHDYAGLILESTVDGIVLSQLQCKDASKGGSEQTNACLYMAGIICGDEGNDSCNNGSRQSGTSAGNNSCHGSSVQSETNDSCGNSSDLSVTNEENISYGGSFIQSETNERNDSHDLSETRGTQIDYDIDEIWLKASFSQVDYELGKEGCKVFCDFSWSCDGETFIPLGDTFKVRQGYWIGAKIGSFCIRPTDSPAGGYAELDYIRFTPE